MLILKTVANILISSSMEDIIGIKSSSIKDSLIQEKNKLV